MQTMQTIGGSFRPGSESNQIHTYVFRMTATGKNGLHRLHRRQRMSSVLAKKTSKSAWGYPTPPTRSSAEKVRSPSRPLTLAPRMPSDASLGPRRLSAHRRTQSLVWLALGARSSHRRRMVNVGDRVVRGYGMLPWVVERVEYGVAHLLASDGRREAWPADTLLRVGRAAARERAS